MREDKIFRGDKEAGLVYLMEGENNYNRHKALEALKLCKEAEKGKNLLPVWIDERTVKLMDMEKIKRKKLEIIRVKIGKGELAWMEKKTAVKNGFICE